jgi:hypothetical protein
MIFDKTGSLANTKRHDYLPFGEELFANQGLRTGTMGYSVNDGVRQKFTQKEQGRARLVTSQRFQADKGQATSPVPSCVCALRRQLVHVPPFKSQRLRRACLHLILEPRDVRLAENYRIAGT